ncbi:hypothetical protein LC048_14990 [Mesobacillus subterraneus]|nr:hypothetical protein [Mesobacillus subterraneus]WLR53816.1 hypothetical protein LC048_14990 [Mesobacillus subterraneus]
MSKNCGVDGVSKLATQRDQENKLVHSYPTICFKMKALLKRNENDRSR